MRTISSALKLKTMESPEKRLKSAVQFKIDTSKMKKSIMQQSQQSLQQQSRLQSGTTYYTARQTGYSTYKLQESEYDTGTSSAFRGQIKSRQQSERSHFIRKMDSQRSFEKYPSQHSERVLITAQQNRDKSLTQKNSIKQLTVTQQNIDSPEIKKRMKYDQNIKEQVINVKIQLIQNKSIKHYLMYLHKKQKYLIELIKLQQEEIGYNQKIIKKLSVPLSSQDNTDQRIIDFTQTLLTLSIGTRSPQVLIETLLFSSTLLELTSSFDWAIFYFNQTRLMANLAKQTMEKYKMKSLLGLGNCAMKMQQYEIATRFFKKALQYSWLNNDSDIENESYEKLGVCYYYLGDIQKSSYYHERAITYDYEIETSPLRIMSCDTLKIFLQKHYNKNYTQEINKALLNRLNLPFSQDILEFSQNEINSDIMISEQKNVNYRRSSIFEFILPQKLFSTLTQNGIKLFNEILNTPEFEVEVYTPKHSFRSESKCFEFLRNKKIHPQDIYHDVKYKHNPFILNNLGVIGGKFDQNPLEDTQKYKLPLNQQIDIRLKQTQVLDIQQKLKKLMDYKYHTKTTIKNKILITHKNIENEKRHQNVNQMKMLEDVQKYYEKLIESLMN